MRRSFRRRGRKTLFWSLILSLTIGFAFFILLFFLGLPLLAKLSLFFGKLKSAEDSSVLIDQTPPPPPQIELPFTATNSAQIVLVGTAEPGSTVKIYLNAQSLEKTIADKAGSFTKKITLQEGKNEILAKAIDQAGNESLSSPLLYIFLKKKGPFLEIEFPPENLKTEEQEIEIRGKTTPGAYLSINGRVVPVKGNGFFSYPFSLSKGENLITIVTQDEVGNKTKEERKVTFSPPPE